MWRVHGAELAYNELQVEGLNSPELEPAAPDEPECVSAREEPLSDFRVLFHFS